MIMEGTRALVVDDDPFVCEMLTMILQGAGCRTETASSGEDAYRKLSAGAAFEFIVSDMNMPGMSGLDLIKKIRAEGIDTPVIILTGNSESALDAMRCGADDYLIKDENIQDTIIFAAGRVLGWHRMKQENIRLKRELADLRAASGRA